MISNNNRMNDETSNKIRQRKVRYVKDAWNAVLQWRDLFENGYYDVDGNIVYPNCDQAALKVGIPLRSLQEYHKTFKYCFNFQQRNIPKSIEIERFFNEKMGQLKKFMQQIKKQQAKLQKEEKEVEQDQATWDNMIIEADDQFSVQIEQDDQQEHQQNFQMTQSLENNQYCFEQWDQEDQYNQYYESQSYDFNDDHFMGNYLDDLL
ncbi:unnamed protein product [Paramecium octaurelia]|uniref:Uncharacterized protein n=1 Tax=Paramecium octaurelia TaxID=43137 RepID=A0A8S1VED6_PAROT|nr:unnamed protein product [Paramecium octaurelia]